MIFSIPAMFKKNKFKKAYLAKKQGFSILEVMLAATVLVVGIVAVIALISSSIRNSANSRDQIIATDLMQEGLELVRNVRDNNQAQLKVVEAPDINDVFAYFPDINDDNNDSCRIDKNFVYSTGDNIVCGSDFALKLDNSNFYNHTDGSATKFSRRIKIKDFDSGNGRKITSIVTWDGKPDSVPIDTSDCNIGNKCVWAETILTNRKI